MGTGMTTDDTSTSTVCLYETTRRGRYTLATMRRGRELLHHPLVFLYTPPRPSSTGGATSSTQRSASGTAASSRSFAAGVCLASVTPLGSVGYTLISLIVSWARHSPGSPRAQSRSLSITPFLP